MWIMTTTGFVSIVSKGCAPDELLVRSRRKKDLRALFPEAHILTDAGTDYRFRAVLPRSRVREVLAAQLDGIGYGNFKDATKDRALHSAYMRTWFAMLPLGGRTRRW